jgi:hypothetical protein
MNAMAMKMPHFKSVRFGWVCQVPWSASKRSDAKDPAPLKIKEVRVKKHRYIVCLNEEERRKDAHDREAVVPRSERRVPAY